MKVYFHEFSQLFVVFFAHEFEKLHVENTFLDNTGRFHRRLRAKTIQMFRQKLRESVHASVQNSTRAQLKLKEVAVKRLKVVL